MWFLGVLVSALPCISTLSYHLDFHRILSFFIALFPRAACSPSLSPLPRPLFEVFFAPASVPPQPVYLSSL